MKILFLFLFGILSVSAHGQKTATSDASVYKDSQFPFSVSIPKGWTKSDDKSDTLSFKTSSENGLGVTNFNIVVRKMEGLETLTPTDFTKMMLAEPGYFEKITKSLIPDSAISSSGKSFLGDKEAIYVIFEGNYEISDQIFPLKFYVSQMFFESNLYTLTFTTGKDDFEKFYPIFKETAASFKVVSAKSKANVQKLKTAFNVGKDRHSIKHN